MATVIDENTGEEVEVVPSHAVASVASVTGLGQNAVELPSGSAKMIEQAMVRAIQLCNEEGITDPEHIRQAMMGARETMKQSLRRQQIEKRSQEQAKAQAAAQEK